MTNLELQALRRLLFFSRPEAAQWVGQCQHRTWNRWEDGSRPIPNRVAESVRDLVAWRKNALDAMRAQIAQTAAQAGALPQGIDLVMKDMDAWSQGNDPALWRPYQSVLAQLLTEYDGVVLREAAED